MVNPSGGVQVFDALHECGMVMMPVTVFNLLKPDRGLLVRRPTVCGGV